MPAKDDPTPQQRARRIYAAKQRELGAPRGLLIVTAIRRKQERDGLVLGPLRRAAG